MDQYYIVEVPAGMEDEEKIHNLARDQFSCQGIEEFSLDEAQVDAILGERSYSGADIPLEVIQEVELTTKENSAINKYYFERFTDSENFAKYLKEKYQIEVHSQSFQQQDWNQQWRESFKAIHVSDKLNIIPSWEKEKNDNPNNLYIYPGMGFGTGNHETTFLCLKLFDEVSRDKSFLNCLDFGCGSGILGLAFAQKYAGQTDLYDIDPDALENCEQNREINVLKSNNINLYLPRDRKKFENNKYDLIFANILQNVLLLEGEAIINMLAKGGFLILSGLLTGQDELVIQEYQKMNPLLELMKVVHKGDWLAILMVKK